MATDSKSKTDKKRLRMSSSTSEDNEENTAFAELLQWITLIEQQAAKRDARISQLETQLAEANLEIKELKSKTNDLQRSLEYTQKDQEDAFDRIAECEQEQALHDDELIRQEIYSRRWNMIFYKVPESLDEDCTSVVRAVLTNDLKIDREEVNGFKFCGVHRLGKQSRGRPRPIIARFTSGSDRDKVWKMRRNLKGSIVKIGEDLPKPECRTSERISWFRLWRRQEAWIQGTRRPSLATSWSWTENSTCTLTFQSDGWTLSHLEILARTRQKMKQKCQLMDQNTTALSKWQTYY